MAHHPDLGEIIQPLLWNFSVSDVVSSMVAVAQGIESACGNPSPSAQNAQGYNGDVFNPIQRWASRAHHGMPGAVVCEQLRQMARSLQAATLGNADDDQIAPDTEAFSGRAFEEPRTGSLAGVRAGSATLGRRIG